MLRIYYGRENVDKDRFLFDGVREALKALGQEAGREPGPSGGGPLPGPAAPPAGGLPAERVMLLVPDQYTLQAERDVFTWLQTEGMMDLEVLSPNRLAVRVLEETGGSRRPRIDRYGRHILLTKLLGEAAEQLTGFRGLESSHSFIDMTNDLISQLKQYGVTPEQLREITEAAEDGSLLKRKLTDLCLVYSRYQEAIQGHYLDTEDVAELFLTGIGRSRQIRETLFWVSGFDSFPPQMMEAMEKLLVHSCGLNLVLTAAPGREAEGEETLFALPERVLGQFAEMADRNGIARELRRIPDSYRIEAGREPRQKDAAILYLERAFYKSGGEAFPGPAPAVELCRAANFYAEAETVAARILELVREEGFRYRDVAVVCNDMEGRAAALKRVFQEYGIPVFLDRKRRLLHNPAVVYLSALFQIMEQGWQYEDVFRLVRTGFSPVSVPDSDLLENYVVQYRIKGNRWKKPFVYGAAEKGEEGMALLNRLRQTLAEPLEAFEKAFRRGKSVREKTRILYEYLRDEARLPEQLQEAIGRLEEEGEHETAEETAQVWASFVLLLDQMVELMGEEPIGVKEYGRLLQAGLEALEIGVLPPTADQVTVGTLQRSRTGPCKAVFLTGVNDGVLPAGPSGDDLLSEDEKNSLLERGIELCKSDGVRAMEETLAIYKILSKPSRYLWAGYSAADRDGKELRPSLLFERLRSLFPEVPVKKDVLNREEEQSLVASRNSTLRHLAAALRKAADGREPLSPLWKSVCNWYRETSGESLEMVERGLFFTVRQGELDKQLAERLYKKEEDRPLTVSPSQLERFSRCPFSHLVAYGLRPEERRIFQVTGRETGDVYHECLMRLSQRLTRPGQPLNGEGSPWMSLTREACRRQVAEILAEVAAEYKEGMLLSGGEERYRALRMEAVCGDAAWHMVRHVQQGAIKEVFFEKPFGAGRAGSFPPLEVKAAGEPVRIAGRIDRVDILDGDYVKIIDYKSGSEKFDLREVEGGWRLQLMLYLEAALRGLREARPAGVFYFGIAELMVDASACTPEDMQSRLGKELGKAFRLDGTLLDDPKLIQSIGGDFTGYSDILPVQRSASGAFSGNSPGRLLKEEDFEALRKGVNRTVDGLCRSLTEGCIDVRPKKTGELTACTYCQYKSICSFDLSFDGCTYDVVK
ncbi:MAG: PD-(D/E)XK nuclease family protein [Bacillota bacterium]|nr:PD-(D/E)XK nuclease family protein [Bacillota bacterium]